MTVTGLSGKDAGKRSELKALTFELLAETQVGQTKPADNLAKPVCYKELKLSENPPVTSKQNSGKSRGLIKEETLK